MSGISEIQREVDKIFDRYVTPAERKDLETDVMFFEPSCDISETETHYLLSFDLPGMKKDQIKVEVLDDVLTVSGERCSERKEERGNQLSVERSYGNFRRAFKLPSEVAADRVEANYDSGVLNILLPRLATAKRREVTIGEKKEPAFGRHIATGSPKGEEPTKHIRAA